MTREQEAVPDIPRGLVAAGDGLLVLDKPAGWTSHDVVARTRRLAATRKVGHAGTLDPMATGVLVLGVGRATRLLTHLVGAEKEYTATVRLGQTTLTDDAEGTVTGAAGADRVREDRLAEALAELRGPIEQVPSAVSAIKVAGQRSYARVRAGEDVELPARSVVIHHLDLTGPPRPQVAEGGTPVLDLDVRVVCSSGTYVRALARDLGARLGTGGHLTRLRRTRVGPFDLAVARPLPEVVAEVWAQREATEPAPLRLTSMTEAAAQAFAVRHLDEAETRAVRVGKFLPPTGQDAGPVAALAPDGHVVALLTDRDGRARPVLVLDPA